jgi:hypothetical protein
MDIDAIIADATASAEPAQPKTETADAKPEVTEADVQDDTKPEASEDSDKPVEDSFPKKAVNALSRRDKKIGQLRERERQLLQELESLKKQTPATKQEAKESAPKEEDFETYGEYLDARAAYAAEKKYSEIQAKQKQESESVESESRKSERIEALEDNAEEAKKIITDFDTVVNAALSTAKLAPHVQQVFLEADNPAFALYALAKEGTLEDLNDMTAYQVAKTVARMEEKGLTYKKQTTKAPAPMSPAKGTGSAGKPLDRMSYDELKEHLRTA